jgi:hypothetical protein
MTAAEDTRTTVLAYFNAWTTNKTDEAYAFLADDLAFWGPTGSYTSAEEFRPALIRFASMTNVRKSPNSWSKEIGRRCSCQVSLSS